MSEHSRGRRAAATDGRAVATDGVDEIADAWRRERPGTPVASIGVLTRIRRLGKLLDDDRRRTLARLGLDAATLDLLSTLRRAGPPYRLAPGEIARRTLVSAGAVTQRVARAERAGLVHRSREGGSREGRLREGRLREGRLREGLPGEDRPAADGRSVTVTLTPAGHAVVERTVDALLHHEESLLAPLTERERARLADLLRTLLAGLADRPD